MTELEIKETTQRWLKTVVINLNLCPFAKKEHDNNRIHYFVSNADTHERLLFDLQTQLTQLHTENQFETTLLIHPNILQDFDQYNQFLNIADALLIKMELEGIFQIASFHPQYQFADTQADDVQNYTNRSPYPMLHIIRESSLTAAVEHYSDPSNIPERNIALLIQMGKQKILALLDACYSKE